MSNRPLISISLEQKLNHLIAAADYLPCITIVHEVPAAAVVWMCKRGLTLLHTTNEELQRLGPHYHERYFNPTDAADYVPKVMGLMERASPDETVSFFQQVRYREDGPYHWYLSVTRLFHFGADGVPSHTVTTAFPIDPDHHLTVQAARLLEENNFLRENMGKLQKLGAREREVLRHIAAGKLNREIAAGLHLSEETVATHRRNIRRKLGASTSADITRYAHALEML